jgi:hypothetical protein
MPPRALQCIYGKTYKPYTLVGFESGNFCSVGGRDDHYIYHAANANLINFFLINVSQELITCKR